MSFLQGVPLLCRALLLLSLSFPGVGPNMEGRFSQGWGRASSSSLSKCLLCVSGTVPDGLAPFETIIGQISSAYSGGPAGSVSVVLQCGVAEAQVVFLGLFY